ncbi:uncharacterized protein PHACADRAFT_145863 [Phanerochaete carnosa HHB-10118-sp]|uniref:C2H2-type domain-containing protein n=1 Tax=Phanerochaete carnosa (strain HHB-10118-sp) TaxID=650164 RepID=K5WUN6_PHACS|nr:uncharacterized protein PHACADRAFT_145863 [Phanerochaete carnosa HHB-10118-sp]EKM54177.1 hypothetical protein PHACADRAFT_145863 [Phanerochaete carnosa HHB-10118-sp]
MSSNRSRAPSSSRNGKAPATFETINGELVELTKQGTISRMRSHRGNKPTIPQSHPCHLCPAKFTRPTHLHRHLRTHSNSRSHKCDRCSREFTRSDLLTRHKRSCGDPAIANRSRRKSCQACADGKTKCDLQQPCGRCRARGCECTYLRKPSVKSEKEASSSPNPGSSASPESSPEVQRDKESFRPQSELTPPPFAVPEVRHGVFVSSFSAPELADYHNGGTSSYYGSSYASTSHAPSVSGYSESTSAYPISYPAMGSGSFAQEANKVNNELNALFSTELFDKFFHDYLDESKSSAQPSFASPIDPYASSFDNSSQFPFATEPLPEPQPFMGSVPPDMDEEFLNQLCTVPGPTSYPPYPLDVQHPQPQALPQPRPQPPVSTSTGAAPYPSELQQYMHLFYQMFLYQMPVMHIATFTIEGKPPVLLSAMQACGALYVKTAAASQFIDHTLKNAREQLLQEFAKKSTTTAEQMHLVLAVVLLQTIGLFHQRPEQRMQSNIYHPMLVSMIRQSGLIQKVTSWQPPVVTESINMDTAWREWAFHETTKRQVFAALLLTYLHDTCHCIYFTQRPFFAREEVTVPLPCEDGLWRANSPGEWYALLQRPSEYGSQERRFRPYGLQEALTLLADPSEDDSSKPLLVTPLAHFILSHAILRKLFEECIERPTGVDDEPTPESLSIQYMLHTWLKSWWSSPETPQYSDVEEPRFLHDALPFYWIAQVALLAYQERLPPFATGAAGGTGGEAALGEAKFRLVKEWLRHIRQFLRKGEQGPTLFWDELHKIRRKSRGREVYSDVESLGAVSDDSDGPGGLLGFFAGEP